MDAKAVGNSEMPRVIRMHTDDNVAIVANEFGLSAGAQLPSGPTLREHVPQGHKVATVDIAEGAPVRRYNVVICGNSQPARDYYDRAVRLWRCRTRRAPNPRRVAPQIFQCRRRGGP